MSLACEFEAWLHSLLKGCCLIGTELLPSPGDSGKFYCPGGTVQLLHLAWPWMKGLLLIRPVTLFFLETKLSEKEQVI